MLAHKLERPFTRDPYLKVVNVSYNHDGMAPKHTMHSESMFISQIKERRKGIWISSTYSNTSNDAEQCQREGYRGATGSDSDIVYIEPGTGSIR